MMNAVTARICPTDRLRADVSVPVLVIGAGACGLTAALSAADAGAEVLVVEKTGRPYGSTSMSSGLVPAAATRFQREQGIDDSVALFAGDIQAKAQGEAVPHLVDLAAGAIGPTLEWLHDGHGLEWIVLDDFLYPGHGRHRMHAVPEKTGEALLERLAAAAGTAGIPLVCDAAVDTLYLDGNRISGIGLRRPDGARESIACAALVLGCNGFGGNRPLVERHLPAMREAPYHGHDGNTGEALLWGEQLGAQIACLSACQGHGSLADPGAVLITWAVMMEGGFQINADGRRFSNEHAGYSEQAVAVLEQRNAHAWCVFDRRLFDMAAAFPDFRQADALGLVRTAPSAPALAERIGVPAAAFVEECDRVAAMAAGAVTDVFGRDFTGKPALDSPLFAVRVTGALFHTQGGLMIDRQARVVHRDGRPFANLFAGGGAACGVSGNTLSGYLSGNGLLTAIAFGAVAGRAAAVVSSTRDTTGDCLE